MYRYAQRRRRRACLEAASVATIIELPESRILLSGEDTLSAVLSGSQAVMAKAEFSQDKSGDELEIEMFNATPGIYSVVVDDVVIGSLQVFSRTWGNYGEVEFSETGGDDAWEFQFPPQWPGVSSGSVIQLQPESQNGSATISGIMQTDADEETPEDHFAASQLTATGAVLTARYEHEIDHGVLKRKFRMTGYNLPAETTMPVLINGVQIGTLTSNSLGTAVLQYSSRDKRGFAPFPEQFPDIQQGTSLTAGNLFSTQFVSGEDDRDALTSDGLHLQLRLTGNGAEQGFVTWEQYTSQETGQIKREFEVEVWGGQPGTTVPVKVGNLTVGAIQFNVRGAGRFKLDSESPEHAFPTGFPSSILNSAISIGESLVGVFTEPELNQLGSINENAREAYELDQSLKLRPADDDFLNWGGTGEKWLLGEGNVWYILRPDGQLLKWNGSNLPDGPQVAVLDESFFLKPELLHNAAPAPDTSVSEDFVIVMAAKLDSEAQFRTGYDSWDNWGGRQEKWIRSKDNRWFFISPDGTVHRWDGKSGANGVVVARLDSRFHHNPAMITAAKQQLTDDDLRYAATQSFDLDFARGRVKGWEFNGIEVEWLRGRDASWYFVTRDGDLHRWNGSWNPKLAAEHRQPVVRLANGWDDPQKILDAVSLKSSEALTVLDHLFADFDL